MKQLCYTSDLGHTFEVRMTLQCYFWDLPMGQAVAFAANPDEARAQIMDTLPKNDFARPELAEALQTSPQLLGHERKALVAWTL